MASLPGTARATYLALNIIFVYSIHAHRQHASSSQRCLTPTTFYPSPTPPDLLIVLIPLFLVGSMTGIVHSLIHCVYFVFVLCLFTVFCAATLHCICKRQKSPDGPPLLHHLLYIRFLLLFTHSL